MDYFTKVASPEQLARRWAVEHGHPAPPPGKSYIETYGAPGPAGVDQATGGRLGWPEPSPGALARRFDEALAELGAATAAEDHAGLVGGCNSCGACRQGVPARCHRPASAASRRHDKAVAKADTDDAAHRARMLVEFGLLGLPKV